MSKFLSVTGLIIIFFSSTFAFAAVANRGGAELLDAKAYSVNMAASVFMTTAHYDDEGIETGVNPDSSYRMIDTDFKISYGFSSNIETSLFAKVRSVSSSDGINTAANTGPESIGGEAKYSFLPVNAMRYAIGVRYRQTLYTNTVYTTQQPPVDEVVLGDDGSEYGVDFFATYLSNPWKLDFKLGYNSPPNDLSSEIQYKAEGLYQFTKLGLFAGVEGIRSLKRDQYTDTPLLKPVLSEG
ncbi:MAG: hypothetical protein EHM20_09735, partial [Alphaproteobacteria bacterium]